MENWKHFMISGAISVTFGMFTSLFMIVILPASGSYTQIDMLARSLPGFFFIIQGIRNVYYAYTHKDDDIFYPRSGLILTERTLHGLLEQSVLGGHGSVQDPYAFVNLSNFPSNLVIKKFEWYITLHNLTLNRLVLKKSKYIVIDSCRINRLRILSSNDVSVMNNSLNVLEMRNCMGNFVHNNKLSREGLKELELYLSEKDVSDCGDKLLDVLFSFVIICGGLIFLIFQLRIILLVYIGTTLFVLLYLKSIRSKNKKDEENISPNIITDNFYCPFF